jgi:small multidrug resistance pump
VSLYWSVLAGAIITAIVGQTLLKSAAGAPDFMTQLFDPRNLVGLVLYGGAAFLYIIALRRIPMSVALPCTAASYIAAALIGYFAFAEPLTMAKLSGIGLICAGVLTLAFA